MFAYPNCDAHITIAYVKDPWLTERRMALLDAELQRQRRNPDRWRVVATPMKECWFEDYAALWLIVWSPIYEAMHVLRSQLHKPDPLLPEIVPKRHVTVTCMFHLRPEVALQIQHFVSTQCLSDYYISIYHMICTLNYAP